MQKALDSIHHMLVLAREGEAPFPPTLLFEEGWMLRLVLQWFSVTGTQGGPFSFAPGAKWYSEGRLASAFLPRHRGDRQAEGHTRADGAIGHFEIGESGQAELTLAADARQFVVVEAKMFSGLSKGTTHAPKYNQAARNVACMAELMSRADCPPSKLATLGFYVLAPQRQIDAGVFATFMSKEALERVVRDRVETYDADKSQWLEDWFLPTLSAMHVACLSWESILTFIESEDPVFGNDLNGFYNHCVEFNRPSAESKNN